MRTNSFTISEPEIVVPSSYGLEICAIEMSIEQYTEQGNLSITVID